MPIEESQMYESVRCQFVPFTKALEGRVPWMYLDVKTLVTVGMGNRVDPVEDALALPFIHKADQAPVSKGEIRAEWQILKSRPQLAVRGYRAYEEITNLRLSDAAMDDLVYRKLEANEAILKGTFPDWHSWPADAQLGVLSMAWALGAGFTEHWPRFTAAADAQDWSTAAAECKISDVGNAGVKPRNLADAVLFGNAAAVRRMVLDRTRLRYPRTAAPMTRRTSLGPISSAIRERLTATT
jgi:GH24 family phage-related lysozyme (muramidase)